MPSRSEGSRDEIPSGSEDGRDEIGEAERPAVAAQDIEAEREQERARQRGQPIGRAPAENGAERHQNDSGQLREVEHGLLLGETQRRGSLSHVGEA